jgi:predicted RNase H-like nuclease (RuvC/YqgF family)
MDTEGIPCQHDIAPPCADSSYSKCPHCSLDLCLEHIVEHQNLLRLEFIDVIDRINQQKSTSNDHSVVDELRAKALTELDNWKTANIEAIMDVYNAERIRVENGCDQCISRTSNVQNTIFGELSMASNAIEKKKNIHPRDTAQLEQKLNELNCAIKKIHEDTDAELTTIVTTINLSKIIELEQRLTEAEGRIEIMTKDYQQKIDEKDRKINRNKNEIQRLQQTLKEQDATIRNLQLKNQMLSQQRRN